jgi:bacteriorhodopsin
VTAVFMLTFLVLFALTPRSTTIAGEKTFHHMLLIANLVGALTYYAAASDLGWSVVTQVNWLSTGLTRQIFFTKYILWVVSFPVAIISIGLLSGTPLRTILYQIFLAWTWVIGYLVAAYTESNYKWGFFAIATVAYLFLAISTFFDSRGYERTVANEATTPAGTNTRRGVGNHHFMLLAWVNFLWLLYPIAWGISDGGNRIGVTGGFIFFGILDLLFVPFFSFAVLFAARSFDHTGYHRRPTHFGEKSTPATAGPTTAS